MGLVISTRLDVQQQLQPACLLRALQFLQCWVRWAHRWNSTRQMLQPVLRQRPKICRLPPLRPKPASSLAPSSSPHNVHFSSQHSGFGAAGPNKRQGIARGVGKMKRKGKHLLFSQPALLPGRWLAQSRQASCCWPRWPMCWEPVLQNEGGGERKESTKPSSSSAGGFVAKSSLFHIPLMYFPLLPPSSPLSL